MIETIYNKESDGLDVVRLPKNIHQIGFGEGKYHIYIEDKTLEFLKLIPEKEKDIRYGVLLGNVKFSKGETYMFINGVADVRDILENALIFGDDIWTGIYEDIKRYYSGGKIVGWFASLGNFHPRDMFHIRKLHLDHFAGNDKLFLQIDREEDEQNFYVYADGEMQLVDCYHIYYEKNPGLEKYVCETHYDLKSKKKNTNTKTEKVLESTEKKIVAESEFVQQEIEEEERPLQSGYNENVYRKITLFSGKAASVFVIAALVCTLGVMYKKGQLDNLSVEMKEVVAGIMNQNEVSDLDNMVTFHEDGEQQITTIQTTQEQTILTEEQESIKESEQQTTQESQTICETVSSVEQTTVAETITKNAGILPEETNIYVVEKGDTLYGICKKLYGNTDNMDIIMQLNGLESPDSICYGNKLIVP